MGRYSLSFPTGEVEVGIDGGAESNSTVKLSMKSTQLNVKGNNPPGMSDEVAFEYLVGWCRLTR